VIASKRFDKDGNVSYGDIKPPGEEKAA